jgi:hypothetical protein
MIASKQKSPWEISDSLIKAQRVDVDRVNRLTSYAGIKDAPHDRKCCTRNCMRSFEPSRVMPRSRSGSKRSHCTSRLEAALSWVTLPERRKALWNQ